MKMGTSEQPASYHARSLCRAPSTKIAEIVDSLELENAFDLRGH
jgi:hypothetical protein